VQGLRHRRRTRSSRNPRCERALLRSSNIQIGPTRNTSPTVLPLASRPMVRASTKAAFSVVRAHQEIVVRRVHKQALRVIYSNQQGYSLRNGHRYGCGFAGPYRYRANLAAPRCKGLVLRLSGASTHRTNVPAGNPSDFERSALARRSFWRCRQSSSRINRTWLTSGRQSAHRRHLQRLLLSEYLCYPKRSRRFFPVLGPERGAAKHHTCTGKEQGTHLLVDILNVVDHLVNHLKRNMVSKSSIHRPE